MSYFFANIVFSIPLFLLSLPLVAIIRYFAKRKKDEESTEKIGFLATPPTTGWIILASTVVIMMMLMSSVVIYDLYPCKLYSNHDTYTLLNSTKDGAYLLLPMLFTALTARMLYLHFRKFSFASADKIDKAFFSLGVASYFLLLMLIANGLRHTMQSGGGCMGL